MDDELKAVFIDGEVEPPTSFSPRPVWRRNRRTGYGYLFGEGTDKLDTGLKPLNPDPELRGCFGPGVFLITDLLKRSYMNEKHIFLNIYIYKEKRKILVILLIFFDFFNYDVAFKIINKLKVNNNNFKFNGDFKNYVTVERIPGEL
jgi:hypothetical protein